VAFRNKIQGVLEQKQVTIGQIAGWYPYALMTDLSLTSQKILLVIFDSYKKTSSTSFEVDEVILGSSSKTFDGML
jgi:hypothetical protein